MKKKTLMLILFCALGLILTGGGVAAFILNYNLASAPQVSIVDDGKTVYATAEAIEGYKGYRFKIESENETIYRDSKVNFLSLAEMPAGVKYSISVCYLGETEGANSKYGKTVEWNSYVYLAAPEITYNNESCLLSWQAVPNASFYIVYHGNKSDKVASSSVDLSQYDGGLQKVYVVAQSQLSAYRKSEKSNELEIEVKHQLKKFKSIEFDSETLLLTLLGSEELNSITVVLDDKEYVCNIFSKVKKINGDYQYTLHLAAIYTEDCQQLGAKPSASKYNIYSDEPLYFQAAE